ncbi:MAG: PAS domain-containing protein [Lachnospiraceae bacterium]|nr:PAS domain-containing protein [Lachnospiraceae bacterium]
MIKQKNILMIIPDESESMELCSWFTKDNFTKVCYSEEEGFGFLENNRDIISAVVLDIRLAKQSDYAHVKRICDDPRFASIPIVAISPDPPTPEDMYCLEIGVSDLISQPCPWELLSRRIYNAIRAKDSATFYEIEGMLKKLPCNIFLKDKEGKYVFCTQYWHHLNKRSDPNWTIRGKTDMEVRKDKENAKKAHSSDMQILSTGIGMKYIIEECDEEGHEFLELTKEPVYDENGKVTGIIALILDVTEREMLKKEVEEHKRKRGFFRR